MEKHMSEKALAAKARLQREISLSVDKQKTIVDSVNNMLIKDYLVQPSQMTFKRYGTGVKVLFDGKDFDVHAHALSQLAGVLEYPRVYMSNLRRGVAGIDVPSCINKMVEDINWHSRNAVLKDRKKKDARYLLRVVNQEVRGYLSSSFKRHLASKPLMGAFLTACGDYFLQPIDGTYSATQVNLQCALPYVYEPFDGEFVAVGMSWGNSDFGNGRMRVSMFLKRINGPGSYILSDAISAVHLGSVIEDTDIELSDATIGYEMETQKGAIRDAVSAQMHPDNVQRLMDIIGKAHEEQVPWHKLRGELGTLLQKQELESVLTMMKKDSGVTELPPLEYDSVNDPIINRWWASAAVGVFADRELDPDRKKELYELSGKILGKAV